MGVRELNFIGTRGVKKGVFIGVMQRIELKRK
jgi:hypothetical protein